MADTVPQKRVLPPRERRQSAAKRRASSPMAPPPKVATPKTQTQSKTPKTASASRSQRKKERESTPVLQKSVTPVVEEILPSKILENQPLPTTRSKQGDDLSTKEYQSIAESAVLAASMHQSRTKWLVDEMFTKYWTKPSKKKGAPEVKNPDSKSMVKLGPCTMVIEPHTFEVMMFTVRDPNAPNVQYRPPPVQYPPPHPTYQPQPGYSNSPMSGPAVQARPPYATPTPYMKQDPGRNYSSPVTSAARHPPSNAQVTPIAAAPPAGARPPSSAPPKPGPNSESEKNPVIQKLATAAASDPDLKALMQVVASSRATPEQLRTFQRHLDRLNAQIARENAEAQRVKAASIPQTPTPNAPVPISRQYSTPLQANPTPSRNSVPPSATPSSAPSVAPTAPTVIKQDPDALPGPTSVAPQTVSQTNSKAIQAPNGTPSSQPAAPNPTMTPQPRPPQPKNTLMAPPMYGAPYATYPSPPAPQPLVKHIVFENLTAISSVQGANSDRYLFPEYAVLDFSPDPRGTVILASFFVIRKGSQILESSTTGGSLGREKTFYKAEEEYYQPVTMRLIASNPKVLETIARAAKPLKVVQEWMENVIKTKKRAEDCYLPLRLPRESDGQDGVLSESGGNVGARVDQAKSKEETQGTHVTLSDMDVDDELKEAYDEPDSMVPIAW